MAIALGCFAAPATTEAAPSFPCERASSPVEQLICSDGVLADLDQQLAAVYEDRTLSLGEAKARVLNREREAWLRDSESACGIRAIGQSPTLAERWRWAPCLAERYQHRLEALGALAEARPSPAVARSPGLLHPLCLDLALGGRAGEAEEGVYPVPIAACNRGYRHVPVRGREQSGWLVSSSVDADTPTWIAYRPLGAIAPERTLVQIEWNGGGSGGFSEIAEVRRLPSGTAGATAITARTLFSGGDRCNGGIADAHLEDNALAVVLQATPKSLLANADARLDVYRYGLYDCASCCAGTVIRRLDPISGDDVLVTATVQENLSTDGDIPDSAQACFDRLVAERGSLPQTFSRDGLADLARDFVASCPVTQSR